MANKKIIVSVLIGLIFLTVIIGVSSFLLLGPGGDIISGDKEPQYWYECTVTVREVLIGKHTYIADLSCENTKRKCGYLFSIFSAEGTLELWDDTGKIAAKDYKTEFWTGEDTLTVRGCSAGNGMRIKLYDSEGNLLQEKDQG